MTPNSITSAHDLPGTPLSSGFIRWRDASLPELQLSPAARRRIAATLESSRQARLRALAEAHTAIVGGDLAPD